MHLRRQHAPLPGGVSSRLRARARPSGGRAAAGQPVRPAAQGRETVGGAGVTRRIRRSAATAAGESAEDLAESIAIEDVDELLFRRGESDLAAAVAATLAASSA